MSNQSDLIKYSRNSVSDLTLSGGVYLGGTGSANYLDDYEEGTFTPIINGTGGLPTASYALQLGKYIKIGNQVTVWIVMRASSISGGSGDFLVSSLPFAQANDTRMIANQGAMLDGLTNDSRQVSVQGREGDTSVILVGGGGSTGSHYGIPLSYVTTATDIRFTFTYVTS